MRVEEYTADAICRAMHLPGFIEEAWRQKEGATLRVLLTPSFHPELCITLSLSSDMALLSVVALTESFWGKYYRTPPPAGCLMPNYHDEVRVPVAVAVEIAGLFEAMCGKYNPDRNYVYLNGMGSESCLVSKSGMLQLKAHVSDPELCEFVAKIVDQAWNACSQPHVRNALANAAVYLDSEIEYPIQEIPPHLTVTQLGILGTPEEKQQLMEMLRNQRENRDEPK